MGDFLHSSSIFIEKLMFQACLFSYQFERQTQTQTHTQGEEREGEETLHPSLFSKCW